MKPIYRDAGLAHGAAAAPEHVRALQLDLRCLGYLRRGIDGVFGDGTHAAVRALQFDLLHNDGQSHGGDGPAPVVVSRYNRGVGMVTGIVDPALADSVEAMLSDGLFPKIPFSENAAADNKAVLQAVAQLRGVAAPVPFLLAMFKQESECRHFIEPRGQADLDCFVTIGLDRADPRGDAVTSRGYGIGQYTLFHHPPSHDELANFVSSAAGNVRMAASALREKFDRFVVGGTPGTTASDRAREHPILPMRLCRYAPSDRRHMRDCKNCAAEAPMLSLGPDTELYAGAGQTYGQAPHYPRPHYMGVPDRAAFLCDWPYAARRYNGSGPDSFNYQARILLNLLAAPAAAMLDLDAPITAGKGAVS